MRPHPAWVVWWLVATGSSLGCLGAMLAATPPLAVCGVSDSPPMRVAANLGPSGAILVVVVGWEGLSLTEVTVTGGAASVGPLPADVLRVEVAPAPGVTTLWLHLDAVCLDGVPDQRWFQLDVSEGAVVVTPILGISG